MAFSVCLASASPDSSLLAPMRVVGQNHTLLMLYFSSLATVIVVGIFLVYLYGYRFSEERFFLYAGLGWLFNASYIAAEGFYVKGGTGYGLLVCLYSNLSTVLFYLSWPELNLAMTARRVVRGVTAWLAFALATALVGRWLGDSVFTDQPHYSFSIAVTGTAAFAARTLFALAREWWSAAYRIRYGPWGMVFASSFGIYALIQPAYIFKHWPGAERIMFTFFVFALMLKITNGMSVLAIMRRYYLEVQAELQHKGIMTDVGALVAAIEHDLRTPVSSIERIVANAKKKFQASQDVVSYLTKIDRERDRIEHTCSIISMVREDPSFVRSHSEKLRLAHIVNAVIKSVRGEMAVGDDLVFKVLERKVLYVRGRRNALHEAIVNVVKNAVEAVREVARQPGHITATIRQCKDDDDSVCLQIDDDGIGIPDRVIPDIKKPGFSTKKHRKPNAGIGLFITGILIELHDGHIEFRSREREGTTVSIAIPKWRDRATRG
jgi:signal transduction histidine kinase